MEHTLKIVWERDVSIMEGNDRSLCVSPWIYSTSDIDEPALVPLLNTNTREIHVSVHRGGEHWDTGQDRDSGRRWTPEATANTVVQESGWPAHCAWRGGAEVVSMPGNPGPSSIAAELGGSSGNTSMAPWLWHSSARLYKEPRSSTAGS